MDRSIGEMDSFQSKRSNESLFGLGSNSRTHFHPYDRVRDRVDRRTSCSSLSSHDDSESCGVGGGKLRSSLRSSFSNGGKLRSSFNSGLRSSFNSGSSKRKISHCQTVPTLTLKQLEKKKRSSSRELLFGSLQPKLSSGSIKNVSWSSLQRRRPHRSTPLLNLKSSIRTSCAPISSTSNHSSRLATFNGASSNQNEEWNVIPAAPTLALGQQLTPLQSLTSSDVKQKANVLNELIKGASDSVHQSLCNGDVTHIDVQDRVDKSSLSRSSSAATDLAKTDDISDPTTDSEDNNSNLDVKPSDKLETQGNNVDEDSNAQATSSMASNHMKYPFSALIDACPTWLSSFIPKSTSSLTRSLSRTFEHVKPPNLHSPAGSTLAQENPQAATETTRDRVRFSIQEDFIPYDPTPEDIMNSWIELDVPRTLQNIEMISRHRGISVSYSEAADIPGKTCMVHIEPLPLIAELLRAQDQHRRNVLAEQARLRDKEDGNDEEDDLEQLAKVAAKSSRWGVELAVSRWWMDR